VGFCEADDYTPATQSGQPAATPPIAASFRRWAQGGYDEEIDEQVLANGSLDVSPFSECEAGVAMSEPLDRLRSTLDELRSQLNELRQRDPQVADHLEATITEAEAALAGKTKPPEAHESISRQLSDAVRDYEASHPALAGNLGAIIDALGRMGI
jgi:hypothetical protein